MPAAACGAAGAAPRRPVPLVGLATQPQQIRVASPCGPAKSGQDAAGVAPMSAWPRSSSAPNVDGSTTRALSTQRLRCPPFVRSMRKRSPNSGSAVRFCVPVARFSCWPVESLSLCGSVSPRSLRENPSARREVAAAAAGTAVVGAQAELDPGARWPFLHPQVRAAVDAHPQAPRC